jgi:hypothetical protein
MHNCLFGMFPTKDSHQLGRADMAFFKTLVRSRKLERRVPQDIFTRDVWTMVGHLPLHCMQSRDCFDIRQQISTSKPPPASPRRRDPVEANCYPEAQPEIVNIKSTVGRAPRREIADLIESRRDKVKQSVEHLAGSEVIQLPSVVEVASTWRAQLLRPSLR